MQLSPANLLLAQPSSEPESDVAPIVDGAPFADLLAMLQSPAAPLVPQGGQGAVAPDPSHPQAPADLLALHESHPQAPVDLLALHEQGRSDAKEPPLVAPSLPSLDEGWVLETPFEASARHADRRAEVPVGLGVEVLTADAAEPPAVDEDCGEMLLRELLMGGAIEPSGGSRSGGQPGVAPVAAMAGESPLAAPPPAPTPIAPEILLAEAMQQPQAELVPLPPTDRSVRVQLDADLAVEIGRRGARVDVVLDGPAETVEPLLETGAELRSQLERSGMSLGDLGARDQGGEPAEPADAEKTGADDGGADGPGEGSDGSVPAHDGLISRIA